MRTRSFALLGLFLAALGGCPTPPDASSGPGGPVAGGPGGPGGAGAPGGEGGPGAQQGGQPGGAGAPAGGIAGPGTVPNGPSGPPSFDTLIQGGETITVTVTVKGGTKGQIDFMHIGDSPKALHVQPFEGEGPHKVTAPAKLDQPVYVSAVNFANGAALGPDDVLGSAKEPVKLSGADLTVTVDMSYAADWLPKADPNATAPGGEGAVGPADTPPGAGAGAPGAPPAGGAPGTPPSGGPGAAGAPGAPPSGGPGAPPAGGAPGAPPAGGAAPTP